MGHVDHGHPQTLVNVLDFHLHVFAQLLVQGTERLIHQYQLRFEHQRSRQGHALLLATGQLAGVALCERIELDHVQHALHPLADIGLAQVADRQRECQVLGHGHVREQGVVLEHHADVAFVRRHVIDGPPVQQDFAGSRGFETRQHHQAGGLARTRRPQQGQELAFANVQVEVFDDQILTVVALLHATEADQYLACPSARIHLAHTHTFLFDDCRGLSLVKAGRHANRGVGEIGISRLEGGL
ncbi:hypothetical protein D9M71_253320 [compost metagenome]